MKIFNRALYLAIAMLLATTPAYAKMAFDFSGSTPVGSWQEREEVITDHKGNKQISVAKMSMLGKEKRDDEEHYWVEMVMDTFKVKKDKRKKTGDTVVVKFLMPKSAYDEDTANAVFSMRKFAKEIIFQSGDQDPMIFTQGGAIADAMLKAMGTEVSYNFSQTGKEKVTVPAGSFDAKKFTGTGSTKVKVIFKTMEIESNSTTWISEKVPFGVVKQSIENQVNGKPQTVEITLTKFGRSGATSKITKTPQEAPQLPDMGDFFK